MNLNEFLDKGEEFVLKLSPDTQKLLRQLAKHGKEINFTAFSNDSILEAYDYLVSITAKSQWGGELYKECAPLMQNIYYYVVKIWKAK